ncbi:hypothetical protein BH20ACT16_BH20ACT16_04330 [soil metagenome]
MATTEVPIERHASRVSGLPHGTVALAGLAATAGVIHFVATVEHISADWELAVFFALIGAAQLGIGWRIFRDGGDSRLLKLAALGSLAVALLWVFSRTTGIPFGPESGVSKVGVGDTIATVLEFAFAALVAVILWRGPQRVAWLSGGIGMRLVPAFLSLSLFMAAVGGHEH